MTPEERRRIYPPYIVQETEKEDPPDFVLSKITDFLPLLRAIWKISNKSYQEANWGKQGQWGDNFMETMETFLGDAEAVLDTSDYAVEMTPKQREMLQELYDKIDWFLEDPHAPYSEYGEEDDKVITDSNWQKIGKYARKVYEGLSGDDLDAWEQRKSKGIK